MTLGVQVDGSSSSFSDTAQYMLPSMTFYANGY